MSERIAYFEERNTDQQESIIFFHGASGSHAEWFKVASQASLSSYHLILVDLPCHSGSKDIGPFSVELAVDEMQKVILMHAHGCKAHIVGFSLGAFVGLVLTARHPDVVLSTFVSGGYPYKGIYKWVVNRPRLTWLVNSMESIPGFTGLMLRIYGIDGDDWLTEAINNKSWETSKAIMRDVSNFGMGNVHQVANSGIRTCVIAAGKMDQVDSVKEMGSVLRKEGKKMGVKNVAVVVRNAYHPWHLQFPVLFADGIRAWVLGDDLPPEFEIL